LKRSQFLADHPAILVGVFVLCITAALAPGYVDNVDSRVSLHTARALLDRGTFALEQKDGFRVREGWVAHGVDGRLFGKFGPGHAAWFIPFVLAGRVIGPLLGLHRADAEEFAVSLSSTLALAVAAGFMFRLLTERLLFGRGAALSGIVAWVFGTFQLSYSGSSYLETPLAAAIVLSAWFASRAGERGRGSDAVMAGLFAAFAVAIKLVAMVFLPVLFLAWPRGSRRRFRVGILAVVPVVVVAVLLALANQIRFGHPLRSGYANFGDLFLTPLLTGLRGYAASPDISLPLYAPGLVLAVLGFREVLRRYPGLGLVAFWVFLSCTVVHGMHTGYHGGTAYGPRYLVPAIVLIVAPGVAGLVATLSGWPRRLLAVAVGACVLAQVPSVLVAPNEYHTIRGYVREKLGCAESLPPRPITDLCLLWLKATEDPACYDLRRLIGKDREGTSEPIVYLVPRVERGFAVWWLLAAREGRSLAPVFAVALLSIGVASILLLLRPPPVTPATPLCSR
jgi:hypothetical protein